MRKVLSKVSYLKGKSMPCRIDMVAIVLSPSNELVRLTHYENVYL